MKKMQKLLGKMISIYSKKFAWLLSKDLQPISKSYASIIVREYKIGLSEKAI